MLIENLVDLYLTFKRYTTLLHEKLHLNLKLESRRRSSEITFFDTPLGLSNSSRYYSRSNSVLHRFRNLTTCLHRPPVALKSSTVLQMGNNVSHFQATQSFNAITPIFIDRVAMAIIRFVASVCVCVRVSVGTILFEPFDLWP